MHTYKETWSIERSIFCIKMYIQSSNRMLTQRKSLVFALNIYIHILIHQCMHLKIYNELEWSNSEQRSFYERLHLASFLTMSINNFISETALKPNISYHTHTFQKPD